jgi:integrase/recombinase XerD
VKRAAAPPPLVRDRLAEELDRYLEQAAERGVAERTLAIYRRDLGQFLSFLRGERVTALWQIDRPLLRRWFSSLRGLRLGSGSIARRAKEARTFTRLVLGGHQDPFQDLRLPRAAASQRRVLSREEVARLLERTGDTAVAVRDRAVIAVLYAAGLRAAELVAIDLRQVDLASGQVALWDEAGEPRPAFLGRVASEALDEYLAMARPVLARGNAERALFVSREAGRLSVRALEHLVVRRARAAGLNATPRDLRATCSAHLREGGASAITVRRLLGGGSPTRPRSRQR